MSILEIFFKLVSTLIVFHFKERIHIHFCSSAVYTFEYKLNQTFTKVLLEFEGQLKANGRRAAPLENSLVTSLISDWISLMQSTLKKR